MLVFCCRGVCCARVGNGWCCVYVVVSVVVSAFGRVDNDYAFGYVAVLRRPRSGYSRRSRFLGGHCLPCVCVVVSVGVLVL